MSTTYSQKITLQCVEGYKQKTPRMWGSTFLYLYKVYFSFSSLLIAFASPISERVAIFDSATEMLLYIFHRFHFKF